MSRRCDYLLGHRQPHTWGVYRTRPLDGADRALGYSSGLPDLLRVADPRGRWSGRPTQRCGHYHRGGPHALVLRNDREIVVQSDDVRSVDSVDGLDFDKELLVGGQVDVGELFSFAKRSSRLTHIDELLVRI